VDMHPEIFGLVREFVGDGAAGHLADAVTTRWMYVQLSCGSLTSLKNSVTQKTKGWKIPRS